MEYSSALKKNSAKCNKADMGRMRDDSTHMKSLNSQTPTDAEGKNCQSLGEKRMGRCFSMGRRFQFCKMIKF